MLRLELYKKSAISYWVGIARYCRTHLASALTRTRCIPPPAPNRGGPLWSVQRHVREASKLPETPMVSLLRLNHAQGGFALPAPIDQRASRTWYPKQGQTEPSCCREGAERCLGHAVTIPLAKISSRPPRRVVKRSDHVQIRLLAAGCFEFSTSFSSSVFRFLSLFFRECEQCLCVFQPPGNFIVCIGSSKRGHQTPEEG